MILLISFQDLSMLFDSAIWGMRWLILVLKCVMKTSIRAFLVTPLVSVRSLMRVPKNFVFISVVVFPFAFDTCPRYFTSDLAFISVLSDDVMRSSSDRKSHLQLLIWRKGSANPFSSSKKPCWIWLVTAPASPMSSTKAMIPMSLWFSLSFIRRSLMYKQKSYIAHEDPWGNPDFG